MADPKKIAGLIVSKVGPKEEEEVESDMDEEAFKAAAEDVFSAIKSGDMELFKSALKACVLLADMMGDASDLEDDEEMLGEEGY
jgi:hypothetical protein